MGEEETSGVAHQLEGTRAKITEWRKNRRKKGPLPEEIWAEVAGLARQLGVSRVSHGLDLSYASVWQRTYPDKKRPVASARAVSKKGLSRFVEVTRAPEAVASNAVLELTSAAGARLTVRLSGASQAELAAVVANIAARCQ